MNFGVISPADWGLAPHPSQNETPIDALGVSAQEAEARARAGTVEWLARQFNEEVGAFNGFYRAIERVFEPPQTTNLIAPWQMMSAYDRYHEDWMLAQAIRASEWVDRDLVISHPMSVFRGGVMEGTYQEAWTKFTADFALTCVGLYQRTGDAIWLERARQSAMFMIQARRHSFAPRCARMAGVWIANGWQSWGRAVEAFLLLAQVTGEERWQIEALRWGDFGLTLQAPDGCFYLIDNDYYNTDLAPDELRALVFLHELTGRGDFLEAALRFAAWHKDHQLDNGAWPLTIDRDGNVVVETVGPGDIPNIGIALLRLHAATQDDTWLDLALRAFRYSLSQQATPDSGHPYVEDPLVQWGFWSWDPYFDYTLAGDQSTHHARGLWFLVDYLAAQDAKAA